MKGRAEIGKGEEPFKKGVLSRGEKNMQKKEARALKVSWGCTSTSP